MRRVFRVEASVYGGRRRWLARRSVVVIELRSCSGAVRSGARDDARQPECPVLAALLWRLGLDIGTGELWLGLWRNLG